MISCKMCLSHRFKLNCLCCSQTHPQIRRFWGPSMWAFPWTIRNSCLGQTITHWSVSRLRTSRTVIEGLGKASRGRNQFFWNVQQISRSQKVFLCFPHSFLFMLKEEGQNREYNSHNWAISRKVSLSVFRSRKCALCEETLLERKSLALIWWYPPPKSRVQICKSTF